MVLRSMICVLEVSGKNPNTWFCRSACSFGLILSSQSCLEVVFAASIGLAAKPFGLRLALLMVSFVGPHATNMDIKKAEIIQRAQPLLRFGNNLRTRL